MARNRRQRRRRQQRRQERRERRQEQRANAAFGDITGTVGGANRPNAGIRQLPPESRRAVQGGIALGDTLGQRVGVDQIREQLVPRAEQLEQAAGAPDPLTDINLGRLDALAFAGPRRSAAQEAALGDINQFAAGAGNRSAAIDDLIAQRRAGLDGILAEENRALRERGERGLDAALQQGQRRALRNLNSRGVRGPLAGREFRDLAIARGQAQAGLEENLLARNIDARRAALADLQGLVQGQEQAEFQRGLAARDLSQRALAGQEAAEFQRGLAGTQAAISGREGINQGRFGRRQAAFRDFADIIGRDIGSRSSTQLGGIGAVSALEGARRDRELQARGIDAATAASQAQIAAQLGLGEGALALQQQQLAQNERLFNQFQQQAVAPPSTGTTSVGLPF